MNKWYRLGQEFSKKYSDKDVYEFLRKNNLCNNFTDSEGKDFTEKHYKDMCKMIGIPEETEDKHYTHGERKYYFNWGFDKNTIKFIDEKPELNELFEEFALKGFTWNLVANYNGESLELKDVPVEETNDFIIFHSNNFKYSIKKSEVKGFFIDKNIFDEDEFADKVELVLKDHNILIISNKRQL